MRRILNALAIFVLVFMVPLAFAGTATVTWTNPTTYTDNSAIAPGDITQTRIEYGSCSGTAFGIKAGQIIAMGTSATIQNLAAGTYCFRAYTTAKGLESGPSAVVSKVVPQAVPNPPVITTVDTIAYRVLQPLNQFAFQRVGTVPLKTVCSSTQKINGYNVVDRAKVKWDGLIQPSVVVAKCG